ncbi:MAG: ATP-binding protein [Leptolyngbyaceae cyanobacterium]
MPASAEFATLCQSQLAMITEWVGAESAAVYLAESWSDQMTPKLLPVAVYPREATRQEAVVGDKALPKVSAKSTALLNQSGAVAVKPWADNTFSTDTDPGEQSMEAQRLAIPMMHEGGVLGILVGWRTDRDWLDTDRHRMEECARSLSLACVLDQRGQWLKTQMSSLDHVQAQQSDRFHELLHQLKSPLTALKTFGRLLNRRLPSEDPNQRLVSNMLRESDRMQELLGYFDDTLQAADDTREEAATTVPLLLPADGDTEAALPIAETPTPGSLAHFGGTLTMRPCAVASFLLPLVDMTQPLAEDVNMELYTIPPSEPVWVQADPKALLEVLNILLENALKYAQSSNQIWLQWGLLSAQQPHMTGILVGDTGPGIPQTDQAHIFERHYRGQQADGEQEGSGLGLAIAVDLIQEMQGMIAVFSPLAALPWALPLTVGAIDEQRGTAFVVWLPQAITVDSLPEV